MFWPQRRDSTSRGGIEYRVAKISLVTGFSACLSVGFQLVSVPVCLKNWGGEAYGRWLALYAAFLLVRSLDSGFVSYVGNKINYLYHQSQDELRDHLGSSISGIAAIGALQLSIGVAACFSNGIFALLGVSPASSADWRSGMAFLVLTATWVLSGSFLGVVHRLLIPTGLMGQAAWWSMGFQASQFAGIMLAATLHFDLLETGLLFAFSQLSVYIASAVYIRRKLPAFYPWWRGCKPRTGLRDLGHSTLLTASNFIQQGTTNGAVILVSALSSPAIVPAFTTVRTLANLWTNATNVLTTPLLPDVIRYRAKGEGWKLATISEVYWVLVGSAVNFGILLTYPFIQPVYSYWTAHAVELDKSLLCTLLAGVVLGNVGGLITMYLNGINRLNVVLAASGIRGVVTLVVGRALFFHFGLAGLGTAIFGGELLSLLVLSHYFFRREVKSQGVELSVRSTVPILISTASVLVYLMSEGISFSLASYIYPVALMAVVTAALFGWGGLDRELRTRLSRMVCGRFLQRGVA